MPAGVTALTFDDSYYGGKYFGANVGKVLDLADHAKSLDVGLYVFQLSQLADIYQDHTGVDVYQELRDRDMYVGNHTYDHKNLTDPKTHTEWEITHGADSAWLRPPGGASTLPVRNLAYKHQINVCTWSFDTLDWKEVNHHFQTGAQICHNVVTNAPKGSVILMHLNHNAANNTTLDCIVNGLRAKGHKLCRPYDATHPGKSTPVRLYKLPC